MAKLTYITNTSLDGYIEDATGSFDWLDSQQVHEYITELVRPMSLHLLGRKLHETMAHWDGPVERYPAEQRAFASVWQQAETIVFSRTLATVTTRRARVAREFDPAMVRALKREAPHDIFIGGAELAGLAFDAGLVDECHLFIYPVIVGGGKPALRVGSATTLELLETRRFDAGVVHVHYRVRNAST